jgi:hypothetical protein
MWSGRCNGRPLATASSSARKAGGGGALDQARQYRQSAATPSGQGGVQAQALGGAHATELVPPGQQGAQLLRSGVGQGARRGELGIEWASVLVSWSTARAKSRPWRGPTTAMARPAAASAAATLNSRPPVASSTTSVGRRRAAGQQAGRCPPHSGWRPITPRPSRGNIQRGLTSCSIERTSATIVTDWNLMCDSFS